MSFDALLAENIFTTNSVPMRGVPTINPDTGKKRYPGDPGPSVCACCKMPTKDNCGAIRIHHSSHKKRTGLCPYESSSITDKTAAVLALELFRPDQQNVTVDEEFYHFWTDRLAVVVCDTRSDNTVAALHKKERVAINHRRLMVVIEYAPKSEFTPVGEFHQWTNSRARLALVGAYTLILTNKGCFRYRGAVDGRRSMAYVDVDVNLVERLSWLDGCSQEAFHKAFNGFCVRSEARQGRWMSQATNCRKLEGRKMADSVHAGLRVTSWDEDDDPCLRWVT